MSYIGNPIVSTDFPKDTFSGNGSTTAFTMSIAPASVNAVIVVVSGITQDPSTYTISGTTLTFSAAPPTGTDNISVRHLGVAGTPQVPALASVGIAQLSATGTANSTTYLRGDNTWTAVSGGTLIPSGTVMLFAQTAAPTGFTKLTNLDNYALRVVSGTAGTGGSVAFTTAFASGLSDNAVTLSTSQIPSHTHSFTLPISNSDSPDPRGLAYNQNSSTTSITTGSQGGGGSHTHTLPSFAVQYVDVIRASKD
jgi:hypothetical protein